MDQGVRHARDSRSSPERTDSTGGHVGATVFCAFGHVGGQIGESMRTS